MDLRGKTVLVTGAGQGIGRAVALAVAGEGALVACNSLHADHVHQTVAAILQQGGRAQGYPADVSLPEEVAAMMLSIRNDMGPLSAVILCAGLLGEHQTIELSDPAVWSRVMEVNLHGSYLVARAALAQLKQASPGLLVLVSSSVGKKGRQQWGAYSVSKFGVEGLAQVLADEYPEGNPKIVVVDPGGTRTSMRAQAYPHEDPMLLPTPDEIARVFLYLLGKAEQIPQGSRFDAREILKNL